MVPTTPSERLRALREGKGLSLQDLAEAAGVPRKTIATWETRTRLNPSRPVHSDGVKKIAHALGVSPDEIWTGATTPSPRCHRYAGIIPRVSESLIDEYADQVLDLLPVEVELVDFWLKYEGYGIEGLIRSGDRLGVSESLSSVGKLSVCTMDGRIDLDLLAQQSIGVPVLIIRDLESGGSIRFFSPKGFTRERIHPD